MSTAPNSQLPDDEALAAFSAGAFGGGRRRRKDKPAPEADTPQTQDATPAVAEDRPTPVEEPAPAPTAEVPEGKPEVREEQPKAVVPAPAPAPEPTSPAPTAPSEPSRQQEPAAASGEHAQIAVRPVSVSVTRTAVPPALQDRGTIEVQIPHLGATGARATQCTVMVSQNVRDRFAYYQLSKKMAGDKEPSNALVVRRAFLHAKRGDLFAKLLTDVYQQQNAVDDEDYDEDGMLGEVVGRRAVRGRLKDSGQQSFRPSEQELATYDAYSQAYGFPSRSDFLTAVLDEFLPQLPASGRRR